ncbi:uncharacterized protein LOC142627619 [Castanea sativa]|uniref:uncharacterized protein LOC142627619 n=1 Tax=Castanea sativa TaxID=21020 RepID=UPI003F6528E7
MAKANMKCSSCVCENDSMSIYKDCPSNELLELFKSKKHARFFVHMLKSLEQRNHDIHNSLCESNSLIAEYKRRNRHLCDKLDGLKRKLYSSLNEVKEEKCIFEGQERLSHACLFIHIALKVFNLSLWYLDSGCSRHMTGDKTLFKTLKEKEDGFVTFGDGSHSQVLGKGTIDIPGLPLLTNVLYIKGLKVNLLSISQICDEDFIVQFSKKGCLILNEEGVQVLKGLRTMDNCYGVVPKPNISCRSARVNLLELWHQRFRHANYKQVAKISKLEAVIGLPNLNDRENLGKFDAKSDEGIFLGYSTNSRTYRVYNKRTKTVTESINVVIDDAISEKDVDEDGEAPTLKKNKGDDILSQSDEGEKESPENESTPPTSRRETRSMQRPSSPLTPLEVQPPISRDEEFSTPKKPSSRVSLNHSTSNIIGDLDKGLRLRRRPSYSLNHVSYNYYLAQFEPKKVEEALKDENWELVPRPKDTHVIGTKWIFKNKTNEDGEVVRNKSRLVAQGYTQVEGVDFDESFTLVARLESIRILLSIACVMNFKLYQIDVKSAFLNGLLNEEVFVEQPKGFQDPHFPDNVLKLKKALYGLKQASRAWYDRLTAYLVDHGFKRGQVDRTLFVKRDEKSLLVAQVYVDDIVFGSTIDHLAQEFSEEMKKEFEMSMVGELNYFLGLQVKQWKDGIFISQEKNAKNLVKRFGLDSKSMHPLP